MTHLSTSDHAQAGPPTLVPASGPIPFSDRIAAMDIARGVALLGIFMVNIQAFANPISEYLTPIDRTHASAVEVGWWLFVHTLFESKFYTLFSLLFGMGFIILTDRAEARRASPLAIAARRFGFLALLGLLHAHLLWYGDILFIYACCAWVLILCRRLAPRLLLALGATLLVLGELLMLAMAFLQISFGPDARADASRADPVPLVQPAAPAPTGSAIDGVEPGVIDPAPASSATPNASPDNTQSVPPSGDTPDPAPASVTTPSWGSAAREEAETRAYRDGPYAELAQTRSTTWCFMILFCVFGAFPRIAGLFLIGAGMIRSRFFDPSRRTLHLLLLAVAALLGLPVAAAATFGQVFTLGTPGLKALPLLWQALTGIGAILLPLGILSAAALLATRAARAPSGTLARFLHPIACTGRMALTNYLTQTLVGTTVCYYYGFAQFGRLDPFDKATLVLGVYCCQVVISTLWLSRYSMGPAEWVWRSFTYLKPAPLRV